MRLAFSTLACPKWSFETIVSRAKEYGYDGVDTCAVDGMCQTACPVLINTGDLVRRLRAEKVNGVEQAVGSGFNCDPATGLVTFAATPSPGAVITAGFAFDVPVRFDTDELDIDLCTFDAGGIPQITLIEIIP